MKLWAWVSRTPATVRSVRKMSSTTLTTSSSRLGKTKRDSCHRLSASSWRRGMKRCSVLGSTELLSVSLSKRSTHQFPRLLISLSMSAFATCGSTTAKKLYANSFFELNHYAFGGVRAQALSVLVLSTSTTGSSRRVPPPRGSRLAVPARDTPFIFLQLARWLRTRRFHASVDSLPPTRLWYGSASTSFLPTSSYPQWVRVPVRPDVFPGRDRHRVCPSQLICLPH